MSDLPESNSIEPTNSSESSGPATTPRTPPTSKNRLVGGLCGALVGGMASVILRSLANYLDGPWGRKIEELSQVHATWLATALIVTGGLAGLLLPNVRLSRRAAAILIGPPLGVAFLLVAYFAMDRVLSYATVDRVFRPFEERATEGIRVRARPRPPMRSFPSSYSVLFFRGWMFGIPLGLVAGVAWTLGRWKWTLAALIGALTFAALAEAYVFIDLNLEYWARRVTEDLQKESLRPASRINPR